MSLVWTLIFKLKDQEICVVRYELWGEGGWGKIFIAEIHKDGSKRFVDDEIQSIRHLTTMVWTLHENCIYETLCSIWYHFHKLKKVKNTKVILSYWCFFRFLNCTNGTKLSKETHIYIFFEIGYLYADYVILFSRELRAIVDLGVRDTWFFNEKIKYPKIIPKARFSFLTERLGQKINVWGYMLKKN